MSTKYLYIDDSGKFRKSENNVSYSFLMFTKEERKKFESVYSKTWWKLASPELMRQYSETEKEQMSAKLSDSKSLMNKDELLQGFYRERLKGQDFILKFNKSIKKQNFENSEEDFLDFLKVYEIPSAMGTVTWCKECSNLSNKDISINWVSLSEEEQINKKKYMILLILKNLLDHGFIKDNDEIKIYIDNEFNSVDSILLANNFKAFLNEPIPTNEEVALTGKRINKLQYKLRAHNVVCTDFQFMDSVFSIFIRCADLLANASYKELNGKYSTGASPENFLNVLYDESPNKFIALKFPLIKYGINLTEVKCNHVK